jgi:hypothetical protein
MLRRGMRRWKVVRMMMGMAVPDRGRLIDRTGASHRRAVDQLLGMRRTISRVGRDLQTGLPIDLHLFRGMLHRLGSDRDRRHGLDRLTPGGAGSLTGGLGGWRFWRSGIILIVPTLPREW